MGYGVVKHTLGRTMIYVRWLAAAHFVFGLVYSITSLVVSPESAGMYRCTRVDMDVDLVPGISANLSPRPVCAAYRPASGGNIDCILRVDAQLPQFHAQGPQRAEAACEGGHVQKALVVDSHQHYCHFRLLLLHQLYFRVR